MKTCEFMRYSAHGRDCASRSECSSCEALRALILAQHQELIAKDKQLLSRESEIEHLKLLLAKLQRMQFGRKSEKLARQIEQLELRLEELESNRSEKESNAPEPTLAPQPLRLPLQRNPHAAPCRIICRAKPAGTTPKETVCPQCQGELRKLGEDVAEMLEYVPASFRGDSSCADEAELHEVRLHRAGGSAEPPDRARSWLGRDCWRMCWSRSTADHLAAVSAIGDLCARKAWSWNARRWRIGWAEASQLLEPLVEALRRYVMAAGKLHADDTPVPVLGAGQWQDQDRAAVDVCSR